MWSSSSYGGSSAKAPPKKWEDLPEAVQGALTKLNQDIRYSKDLPHRSEPRQGPPKVPGDYRLQEVAGVLAKKPKSTARLLQSVAERLAAHRERVAVWQNPEGDHEACPPPRNGQDITAIPSWKQTITEFTQDEDFESFYKLKGGKEYAPSDDLNSKIKIFQGSVTDVVCDALVNAANTGCLGGGGVDGAVHNAAGNLLYTECCSFDGCATGECRMTKAYDLPCGFVMNAVGPMGEDARALAGAYTAVFDLAHHHNLESVAFCCISTGIFGYPVKKATTVALTIAREFLDAHPDTSLKHIAFVCFRSNEVAAYEALVPCFFPPPAGTEVTELTEKEFWEYNSEANDGSLCRWPSDFERWNSSDWTASGSEDPTAGPEGPAGMDNNGNAVDNNGNAVDEDDEGPSTQPLDSDAADQAAKGEA